MSRSFEGARSRNSRNRTDARFPQTMWAVVTGAASSSPTHAQQALESLCRAYWEPIYAFIRHSGKSPCEAEDLTQRFFEHLLAKNRLRGVRPEKGQFRSFLRRSIKNFLVDDWRRKPAPERKGLIFHFEIDAEEGERHFHYEPVDKLSPEKIFERVWTHKVLDQAMGRLEQEFTNAGKREPFDVLHSFLPGCDPRCSRAEAAQRLGITVNALDTAFHRMKKRYRELLRQVISETLDSPTKSEIEEELSALMSVFSQ
jgi:RNA polymerase sigma-70 factor (ECF subfamily)